MRVAKLNYESNWRCSSAWSKAFRLGRNEHKLFRGPSDNTWSERLTHMDDFDVCTNVHFISGLNWICVWAEGKRRRANVTRPKRKADAHSRNWQNWTIAGITNVSSQPLIRMTYIRRFVYESIDIDSLCGLAFGVPIRTNIRQWSAMCTRRMLRILQMPTNSSYSPKRSNCRGFGTRITVCMALTKAEKWLR